MLYELHDLTYRYPEVTALDGVPLAILAVGLGLMASLSFCCGMLLDTVVRHRKEEFFLRMRNLECEADGQRSPVTPGSVPSRCR